MSQQAIDRTTSSSRFKPYAEEMRLIVVPKLTHYGHVESYNERLANLMVTAFKEYFS